MKPPFVTANSTLCKVNPGFPSFFFFFFLVIGYYLSSAAKSTLKLLNPICLVSILFCSRLLMQFCVVGILYRIECMHKSQSPQKSQPVKSLVSQAVYKKPVKTMIALFSGLFLIYDPIHAG